MKTKAFKKELHKFGFKFSRANKHEIWSSGSKKIIFPRTKEINRMLSKRLLKEAEENHNGQQQNT